MRTPTTPRTTPDAVSRAGPPARRENRAPAIVPGITPSADQTAARGRVSPDRTYATAFTTAAGMTAGSGEATTTSPGAPSSASTGVATEEPPTPDRPMHNPITAPTTMMTGHGAMASLWQPAPRQSRPATGPATTTRKPNHMVAIVEVARCGITADGRQRFYGDADIDEALQILAQHLAHFQTVGELIPSCDRPRVRGITCDPRRRQDDATSAQWRLPKLLVQLLAGRQSLAVLSELITGGRRYQDFHDALDGISYKVLTEALRRAERDGPRARCKGQLPASPPAGSTGRQMGGRAGHGDRRAAVIVRTSRWA